MFGFVVAWTLVRYRFPGRQLLDALVDLPFALPTAVSGIALTTIYSQHGWIGQYLEPLGIKAAFSPLGITHRADVHRLAVRGAHGAAGPRGTRRRSGGSGGQSGGHAVAGLLARDSAERVAGLVTGFALAFARALGEYGSVVFISGNMPLKTEITSLLIITKLEQYDYAGATAIAVMMLVASFVILLAINTLQWWVSRGYQRGV